MATATRVADLAHGFARAASDPGLWPEVLARAAPALGLRTLIVHFDARVPQREPRMAAAHGLEREFLESYGARFRHADPGWAFLEASLEPDVVARVPLSRATSEARAFHAEWLAPQELRPEQTLAMLLARDGDSLSLCTMYRERRSSVSDADLRRILPQLAPHLRRAVSITRALVACHGFARDTTRLLATATIPIAVIDSLALLLGANERLVEYCTGPGSLRIGLDRLVAVGPAAEPFRRALSSAARSTRPAPSWVELPRADGRPPDHALVCPIPGAIEGLVGVGVPRAMLLLPTAPASATRLVAIGECEIDREAFELRRAGAIVEVEPLTLELLLYLVSRAGSLVTHAELIEHVWGGTRVSYWAVARAVRQARRAIGDDGSSQNCIETVHGRGYRLRRSCLGTAPQLILS